jgi:nicotinamide-nucleotide adenylyltransferase
VTGRFQPVHEQHLELFEIALRDADHLIIAVTNPDPGARREEPTSTHRHRADANPFTYYERARMLEAALAARGLTGRTTVVPFDLTRPATWVDYVPRPARQVVRAYSAWERHKAELLADAGYPVTVIEGDPATKLSATDIRARLGGDPSTWADLVPAGVGAVLVDLLAARAPGPGPDRT